MNAVVASINFAPDKAGIAAYSTDLALYLAETGASVTMVTGFPYYPRWRKEPADRRRLFAVEQHRGIRVLRGYLFVPKKPDTLRRALHELSFTLFAALNFLRAGRHDTIITLSPPLFLGLVGIAFKKLWKARFVFHVQDLQPDAALSLGMVRRGLLARALLATEAFIYRHADLVAVISDAMRDRILEKGVPAGKVHVVPNWINLASVPKHPHRGAFRSQHPGLSGKTLVAYAGNIGRKQGLDVLVDLAHRLESRSNIHFVIAGDGAARAELVERARSLDLKNVTFLPFLDLDRYYEVVADTDIFFLAQQPGAGDVFFPSKLLGIMALGCPTLVAANPESELARVVCRSRIGVAAPYSDLDSLESQLLALSNNPSLRETLAHNARNAVQPFERSRILSKFLTLLETPPT